MQKEPLITDSSFQGTGWSFPLVFDNADYKLQLSHGEININQSINVLLCTVKGSRSMLPHYGCNLSSFLFQRLNASLEGEIVQMVKITLLNGEPRIRVNNVTVSQTADDGTINILINYNIKVTNTRHNHVFPFSLKEATNLEVGI